MVMEEAASSITILLILIWYKVVLASGETDYNAASATKVIRWWYS